MHELAFEHESSGDVIDVTPRCPRCHSARVESRNFARRLGGAIGAIAGTTSGMALAVIGAEVRLLTGPIGAVLGGLAGIVIEGIVGGATGCAAGSKLGAAVDQNILRNQHCRDCGHAFSEKSV